MKVFLFIMLAVTIQNIAKANDQVAYEQCLEEQRELIEENADSYTEEQLEEQRKEIFEMCKV
jgi:hypothetical protein